MSSERKRNMSCDDTRSHKLTLKITSVTINVHHFENLLPTKHANVKHDVRVVPVVLLEEYCVNNQERNDS